MSYVITTTVDIDAGTEEVWDVLVDFPAYGEWSNFSSAQGTAQVGTQGAGLIGPLDQCG